MKTVYIKFRHKDDVYAICPDYDLRMSKDEFVYPKICGKCGNTLYIPVELPEEITFSIPLPDIYKPLPRELPYLAVKSEPELPTLAMFGNISYSEQQRLKRFYSMGFVDSNGFEMLVSGISQQPVKHICEVV